MRHRLATVRPYQGAKTRLWRHCWWGSAELIKLENLAVDDIFLQGLLHAQRFVREQDG